jgi:8-oxo-dGTP pyrophosphatase MutT (NUDIX family)
MNTSVHKVTCFIIRPGKNETELLLFNHPDVGVQIPAGTVNPGEDPETAARREAGEESGLEGLILLRKLGEVDDPPPAGYILIAHPTPVYSRPDTHSYGWAHYRTGLPVEVLRHEAGFTQVRFEETDRFIDPQYATYSITGWVPDEALASQRIRHFYLFNAPNPTPNRWSVAVDYTIFELFWAALNKLPPIVTPQDGWVRWLSDDTRFKKI